MKDNSIITLADSNYYEMLMELINSIQKHPESKSISICVLDAGLTPQQAAIVKSKVYKIKYSLNLLPSIGTYLHKETDPYTKQEISYLKNEDITLLA